MTNDEVIEMARSVNIHRFRVKNLRSFIKLVEAKAIEREREACAKIADEWAVGWPHPSQSIAERIRERGEK